MFVDPESVPQEEEEEEEVIYISGSLVGYEDEESGEWYL